MSKFYGQVIGQAATVASRRGADNIRASVQSLDGSLAMRMYYDKGGALMVDVEYDTGSGAYGETIYRGTVDALVKKLKGGE